METVFTDGSKIKIDSAKAAFIYFSCNFIQTITFFAAFGHFVTRGKRSGMSVVGELCFHIRFDFAPLRSIWVFLIWSSFILFVRLSIHI